MGLEVTPEILKDYDAFKSRAEFPDLSPEAFIEEKRTHLILHNYHNVIEMIRQCVYDFNPEEHPDYDPVKSILGDLTEGLDV